MNSLICSDSLISLNDEIVLSHLPCSILIKNETFHFVAANQVAANLTGFKNPEDMIDLNDTQLKCSAAEFAKEIQKQDQLVLDEGKQSYLDIGYYPGSQEISVLLTNKNRMHNNQNHAFILASTMRIPVKALNSIMFGLLDDLRFNKRDNCSFLLKNNSPDMKLSDKQAECLYFILRGKSTKEIAVILKRSHRTIEDHINLLKDKFSCVSRSQLIERAMQLGFGQTIPPSLFNKIWDR